MRIEVNLHFVELGNLENMVSHTINLNYHFGAGELGEYDISHIQHHLSSHAPDL